MDIARMKNRSTIESKFEIFQKNNRRHDGPLKDGKFQKNRRPDGNGKNRRPDGNGKGRGKGKGNANGFGKGKGKMKGKGTR